MTIDTASATALADSWLRMWSEVPSLAHDLVADPFAIWFGNGPVGDTVTTAADLQAFVERYRVATPNTFTTGVVVADPATGRAALTWEVELSAGRGRLTGVDVLVLDDDGRIRTVWSVTGDRLLPHDAPAPGATATTRAELDAAARSWAGDLQVVGDVVVDEAAQRVALTWERGSGDTRVGAAAVLALAAGAVQQAWSVEGAWPLRFV